MGVSENQNTEQLTRQNLARRMDAFVGLGLFLYIRLASS